MQYKGIFASSTNPSEISNRVKGIVLASSSVLIFVASQVFGIDVSPNDIIDLGTQLGAVAGAVWTIYGAFIWAINKWGRV